MTLRAATASDQAQQVRVRRNGRSNNTHTRFPIIPFIYRFTVVVVCSLSNTATRIYTNTGEAFNLIFFSPFHLAGNKGTTCSNDSAATFIAPVIKGRSAQILPRAPAGLSSHNDHPASRAIDFSDSFVSHSRLLCTSPRTEKGDAGRKGYKEKSGRRKKTNIEDGGSRRWHLRRVSGLADCGGAVLVEPNCPVAGRK